MPENQGYGQVPIGRDLVGAMLGDEEVERRGWSCLARAAQL